MATAALPGAWGSELEEFAAWYSVAVGSIGTLKLRLYHVRRFARTVGVDPAAVTLELLTGYLADQEWSPSTLRSVMSSLRSFYAWAAATGRVSADPTRLLPKVRVPRGVPRPAPEPAVEAGLGEHDERLRLMIRLAAQAGLRCCEIALVHSSDVVRDLVGWSLVVHGKGGKDRVVPLNDGLAAELRRHGEGWLFPGQADGHLSAAYVSKLISRALPEGVTAHRLRHRFASRAYAGTGGDIRAVQELLGHASVATTQIYTAVPDGALRRGVLAAAV